MADAVCGCLRGEGGDLSVYAPSRLPALRCFADLAARTSPIVVGSVCDQQPRPCRGGRWERCH